MPIGRTQPAIVAHRGACHDAPENTLAAFNLAWQQGSDIIEGDFQLTSDGEIVCYHDETVRLSDGTTRKVCEVSLNDLQKQSGIAIPTILEVFETIPAGKGIFVEIKCGPEILPQFLTKFEASGLGAEQVTIISFNQDVIMRAKSLVPDIKAHWLVSFRRNNIRLIPSASTILGTLKMLGADGVGVQASWKLSSKFVSTIKEGGFEFHVWTVDSPWLAKKIVQTGIDSITTNRPGYLRSHLLDYLT